jgi:hypothetical protein
MVMTGKGATFSHNLVLLYERHGYVANRPSELGLGEPD